MLCRTSVWVLAFLTSASICLAAEQHGSMSSNTSSSNRSLIVGNDAGETIDVSPEDYAKLPRTALRAKVPHSDETATYEGVLVYELLQRAGVRFQDPSTPETLERKLPGSLRTSYVLVEAADGYQVVFSLAEVHPELGGRNVLLADRKNGQPLAADTAPYQVIVKDGPLQDRWIRQVTRILIQRAVGLEQEKAAANRSPDSSAAAELVVRNESGNTVSISPADFAKLPRTRLRAGVPGHADMTAMYEGALLADVLDKAGVRFLEPSAKTSKESKEKRLPAALRSAYVLIEAADGYQVVFTIPEIHPEFGGPRILLADREEGQPLQAGDAPLRLIVPGSELYEVWIRQVTRILVQRASASAVAPRSAPQPGATSDLNMGGLYLIGIGPGDPDLITVKAANVLRNADVVFCFSWVKDELAHFVRPDKVVVVSPLLMAGRYFGQKPEEVSADAREHVMKTNEELAELKTRIERLLADGKTVAFADNGDPLVFSPWAWVTEQFASLSPSVIPGISSFSAANAALRQGVTGLGSILITSNADIGVPDKNGRLATTIVYFTHQKKLDELLPLLQGRYPADTPVAIVCDASYPKERVIRGNLGEILSSLRGEELSQLYLVYVGDGLKSGRCCP